ncbi:MAG TPA: hypothetical protein VG873_10410 [Burkholderiales bacterium]|nr:hypothetical protein [Burkholderiales bacterium]
MGPGTGMLAIWHDVAGMAGERIDDWYNHEHHPERLSVPGFLEARRGRLAGGAGPQFCSLYRTTDPAVLQSPAYLARLASPTPRTREIMPLYRNMSRTVSRIALREGDADGGAFACLTGAGAVADVPAEVRALSAELLDTPPVLRCTFLVPAAVAPQTVEANLRGRADASVGWAMLVDVNEPDQAVSLLAVLRNSLAKLPGAANPLHCAAYRVVYAGRRGDIS